MKEYTMVIPTYWGRSGHELVNTEKIVFDHPTPLNERGTLSRLLDSLKILKKVDKCKIVVIAVPNDPEISRAVRDKVNNIIAPYHSYYDIITLHNSTLNKIREYLSGKGLSQSALGLINLDNYASVRNICSIAGILNASPYTIFIDDDEVFTDPNFILKIEESMHQPVNNKNIQALAGYYLQPDTYRLDEHNVPSWRAQYWNNAACMNEAFDRIIGHEPRLKPTPFVFGGNMTLTLYALKKVPFDPRITRGEDIDFLLNLRISGIPFYLDRNLSITHLPPASSSRPDWKKLREDALRFLYDRKKVMDHPSLALDDLMPYPGLFLGKDLEERIIKTNELLMQKYEAGGDKEGITGCRENIEAAKENPFQGFDTRTWLRDLTARWQEITTNIEGTFIVERAGV